MVAVFQDEIQSNGTTVITAWESGEQYVGSAGKSLIQEIDVQYLSIPLYLKSVLS
jgi:hypothetical protein